MLAFKLQEQEIGSRYITRIHAFAICLVLAPMHEYTGGIEEHMGDIRSKVDIPQRLDARLRWGNFKNGACQRAGIKSIPLQ